MHKLKRYIRCIICDGTLKMVNNKNNWGRDTIFLPSAIRCSSCGCEYTVSMGLDDDNSLHYSVEVANGTRL